MCKKFVKISNNVIYGESKSMIQKYGINVLPMLVLLDGYTTNFGKIKFTLEEMVIDLRFTPNNHIGKINDKIRSILVQLQRDNILISSQDLSKIKSKELIVCTLNDIIEKNKDGKDTKFFCLDYETYNKIMTKECKCRNIIMLAIYCYILTRIKKNTKENEKYKFDVDGAIMSGSCIEETHFSVEQVTKDLCIDKKTYIKALEQLTFMELVFVVKLGELKEIKTGKINKQATNIYVLDSKYITSAKWAGIQYWKEKGYALLDDVESRDKKHKNKVNRQRKSYLKKKINKGIATQEEIQEYLDLGGVLENIDVVKDDIIEFVNKQIDKKQYFDKISLWNNKYNTTLIKCNNINLLLELKNSLVKGYI